MSRWLVLCGLAFAVSCGGDEEPSPEETGSPEDTSSVEASVCETLGLPVAELQAGDDSDALYAIASDFTVPTTDGDWNFADNWSGCETYLFIQDVPSQTAGWTTGIWERDVEDFFERLPLNTRVFFVSDEDTGEEIEANLGMIQEAVSDALDDMDSSTAAWWADRVHFITWRSILLEGWVGSVMMSPGWGVGIDRFQRIRYIGSYADYSRYDENYGWFAPNLSMAANESIYYNFEAERQTAMDAVDATVVEVFTGERCSGSVSVEADLPDAATMAEFDTLEIDLYMGCEGEGEYGYCPAWDYMAYLYLCDADDPDSCTTEIGRWITTYHREGRWVYDVSSYLPLMEEGGTRTFKFETTGPYELTLDLRLSNQSKETQAEEITYLYSGGTFNSSYNAGYEELSVDIPADAEKVTLATVISGHGMADPGNCAEFCNTTHHFWVNGTEYERDFEEAGAADDCMQKVAEGTVPNQYGTWWYGRSGWCPGKEVPTVTQDITKSVTPGEPASFYYQGYYNGSDYTGSATIRMRSWLVIER